MQISPQTDKRLHQKLPIDADEKILAIYHHHWFAYVASWVIGILVAFLIIGAAIALTMLGDSDSTIAAHKSQILVGAGVFASLMIVGSAIPVYLRSQEQLVLTQEAVLQVLQPSLFASKVDQLGLQHIADVSVHQDFFGTIFGYGHITLETPGEQDNYEFYVVPTPQQVAREIVQAHENYTAALMGGRMPTTLGATHQSQVTIDPQQYQQFLAYQQMIFKQQGQQPGTETNNPTDGQPPIA